MCDCVTFINWVTMLNLNWVHFATWPKYRPQYNEVTIIVPWTYGIFEVMQGIDSMKVRWILKYVLFKDESVGSLIAVCCSKVIYTWKPPIVRQWNWISSCQLHVLLTHIFFLYHGFLILPVYSPVSGKLSGIKEPLTYHQKFGKCKALVVYSSFIMDSWCSSGCSSMRSSHHIPNAHHQWHLFPASRSLSHITTSTETSRHHWSRQRILCSLLKNGSQYK